MDVTLATDFARKFETTESRKYFAFSAMVYDYLLTNHNDSWITWYVRPFYFALMSGCNEIIMRFCSLSCEKRVKPSKDFIAFMPFIYPGLLTDDKDALNTGLSILDMKIKKNKEVGYSNASKMCIMGIVRKDSNLLVKGIQKFQTGRMKAQLSRMFFPVEFISFEATFYVLMAQRLGVEIDFQVDDIVLQFLSPVKSAPTIPYGFLVSHCQSVDLNWKFEPLFPEIDRRS